MAEGNNGQSKGLGELFVEFGQKGGSGLMKALNGISAQFLLTKNTAQQAINMVKDFSKNALNTTVAFDKFNATTGISVEKLRGWDKWLKLNNYSTEEFLGNIASVQQELIDIQSGKGGHLKGWTLLGLDPHNFDFHKPEEALTAVLKRLQQVDEAVGSMALDELGWSKSLLYLAKQHNDLYDTRYNLDEENIKTLREQQDLWNALNVTWEAAQQKFIANQRWINTLLKDAYRLLNLPIKSREEQYQYIDEKSQSLKNFVKDNWYLWFTPFGALINAKKIINNDDIEDYVTGYQNYKKNPKKTLPRYNITSPIDKQNKNTSSQEITNRGTVGNEQPMPFYAPVDGSSDYVPASVPQNNSIPPNNVTSYNTNNVININQTINSTADPVLVANESTNGIKRSLSQIELSNPQVV